MMCRILFLFLLVSNLAAESPKLNSGRPVSRESARQPPLAKPSQSQPTESCPKKESTFGEPGSTLKRDLPKPKVGTMQRNVQIRPPSDSPPPTPPKNGRSGSSSSFGSSPLHRKAIQLPPRDDHPTGSRSLAEDQIRKGGCSG